MTIISIKDVFFGFKSFFHAIGTVAENRLICFGEQMLKIWLYYCHTILILRKIGFDGKIKGYKRRPLIW
ncbi:hypothetical protein [Acetivibrio straminisolvens]|uniref:Uncharacterized protein n=1 Tax=Acetivibrio straminisolvens JCM 21531 TaxID=1294263 RepID=W4V9B6_9FIRM|nr:hypothetical protein [Acetivibrio straminisolvens]GAE89776.1 hypothetical protein JCM21531_3336 [Acetivibrio straminisolvens JCM 21531]